MTFKDLQDITRGIAPVLKDYVSKELEPLRKRILELEQRPDVAWKGVWQENTAYVAGALITRRGGLWLATRSTGDRPGDDNSGWRLVCKEGRGGA